MTAGALSERPLVGPFTRRLHFASAPSATVPSAPRLFSTDLDGTLLGHPAAAARFTEQWSQLPADARPILVYNTGRTVANTRALVVARALPEPDFIIGNIGTELHDRGADFSTEFIMRLEQRWNYSVVDQLVAVIPGIQRQPPQNLSAFKSSWIWIRAPRQELVSLERRLDHVGIEASVIYSCRYFLDVVPRHGGKGPALAWLATRLGIALRDVLVAGDSGNDTSMFQLPDVRGIIVENALPELLGAALGPRSFVARSAMADGVIEGLIHFGVLPRQTAPTFAFQP